MLLPRWFPFHLSKVSYWARTVLVPLLVLQALKPRAKNPRGVTIDELFVDEPPQASGRAAQGAAPELDRGSSLFRGIDAVLRPRSMRSFPKRLRAARHRRGPRFVIERLNGEDGLGAIFPAMANSVLMYDVLGDAATCAAIARGSVDKLLVVKDDEAYCQPCVSPVWDTALACHALLEAGDAGGDSRRRPRARLAAAAAGARRRRRLGGATPGRAARRLGLPIRQPALSRSRRHRRRGDGDGPRAPARRRRAATTAAIARGARMGAAACKAAMAAGRAFDVDNIYHYLNNIPFADHGALIDPPTEDVTARCVSMLAQLGETRGRSAALARGARTICAARRRRTAAGTAAGASITSTAPGRCCARSMRCGIDHASPEIAQGGRLAASRSRTRTAAGARTARATGSTIAATSRRRAPPRRPPGRCLG